MRDYTQIDKYLDTLIGQIYPQPQDPGHTAWAMESLVAFTAITGTHHGMSVLDLGCGEAFLQEPFEALGYRYEGFCLGEDYQIAKGMGRNVYEIDFSFIPSYWSPSYFLYSRHSLEHSPAPLLTLMEWNRLTKGYLGIVVPSPDHWKYGGQNHYYVLHDPQWRNLFDVAGFNVTYFYIKRQNMTEDPTKPEVEIEYWYLLEKKSRSEAQEIG